MNQDYSAPLVAFKLITALFKQGEISEDLYRKVSQLYYQSHPSQKPESPYP
jgi:hypothetical protein